MCNLPSYGVIFDVLHEYSIRLRSVANPSISSPTHKAVHAEFEEAWTEREEARKAVYGTLAGGSAFRMLLKACRKLREIMQAAEDRYLEVYACELEEFTLAGDTGGWYGHLNGG